jgi:hypothetical protein
MVRIIMDKSCYLKALESSQINLPIGKSHCCIGNKIMESTFYNI